MRRALLVVIVLLVGVVPALTVARPAWACSCAMATTAEHVERADVVVRGVVTGIDRSRVAGSSTDPVFTTVRATHVWKGPQQPEFVVSSEASGASCGLELNTVGQEVILFAQSEGSGWTANLCNGTAPAASELAGEVEEALGVGTTVSPAPSSPTPTPAPTSMPPPAPAIVPAAVLWVAGTLLAVAVAAIVLAWLGRARRRD